MEKGKLKWYNPVKGFGFITPEKGGKDIFVHVSQFKKAGITDILEGIQLEYQLEEFRGRNIAANIKKI